MKKADVRYRRPYQTRHTYASMMLSTGGILCRWQSTWDTATGRVYGRWMPAVDMIAGEKAFQMWTSERKDDNIEKNLQQVK